MEYADYRLDILTQLNKQTGLDLVWEDFVLSNQKVVSGKTIEVTMSPTEQGLTKFKGTANFRIDRMDLSNKTYVFEWQNDAKVYGSDLFLNDQSPANQKALLTLLSSFMDVELDLADFVPVEVQGSLTSDVTVVLEAQSSSFYYYGKLKVTLTHPWNTQVVMDINPAAAVNVTAALVGNGTVTVDGVAVTLPYSIPAGGHQVTVKMFSPMANGFAFLTPTRLRLLRVYSGKYNNLFKGAVALTTIDSTCVHAAGGTSTTILNLFDGCKALKTLPDVLFMPDSSVSDMAYLFANSGLTSVPATLFKNMNYVGRTLDYLFQSTASLTTVPGAVFDPIGRTVTSTSGMFQQSAILSLPAALFTQFSSLTVINNLCYGCTKLQSIPAGLLDPLTTLTTLNGLFRLCTALVAIPSGLFDKNVLMASCIYVFADCNKLAAIPAGLLTKNIKLIQISFLFSNTAITTIPSGLLDTLTELVYATGLFNGCKQLTTIVANLFTYNTKLAVCTSTFDGCVTLTAIPVDLFANNKNLTNVSLCFRAIPLAFTIPAGFFPGVKITDCSGVFQNSGLTAFDAGLFAAHTGMIMLYRAFAGTAITAVPANTFNVTGSTARSAMSLFADCLALESIATNAVILNASSLAGGISAQQMFDGCVKLKTVAKNSVQITGVITSLAASFRGCGVLKISVADLLAGFVVTLTNVNTTSLDCTDFCNGVIWLTGKCADLWLGITGGTTTVYRTRDNLVEQCFLLADYESVGKPWWTTAINLSRIKNTPFPQFKLEDVYKDNTAQWVPKFASYNVDLRLELVKTAPKLLNVVPDASNLVWLSTVFMALGLPVPAKVTEMSTNITTRGGTGFPTADARAETQTLVRLVVDRSVIDNNWDGLDVYWLCCSYR